MSTNNIHAFIKNGNNVVIERVHALVARLVVSRQVLLSLATDVNLNEGHPGSVVLEARVIHSDDTW